MQLFLFWWYIFFLAIFWGGFILIHSVFFQYKNLHKIKSPLSKIVATILLFLNILGGAFVFFFTPQQQSYTVEEIENPDVVHY